MGWSFVRVIKENCKLEDGNDTKLPYTCYIVTYKVDGEDYVDETTEDKAYKNDVNDKYQQYRFDFRNLHYLIDSDGYLVARVNGSYDYETTGPQ